MILQREDPFLCMMFRCNCSATLCSDLTKLYRVFKNKRDHQEHTKIPCRHNGRREVRVRHCRDSSAHRLPADNDLFMAARLSWSDAGDTSKQTAPSVPCFVRPPACSCSRSRASTAETIGDDKSMDATRRKFCARGTGSRCGRSGQLLCSIWASCCSPAC